MIYEHYFSKSPNSLEKIVQVYKNNSSNQMAKSFLHCSISLLDLTILSVKFTNVLNKNDIAVLSCRPKDISDFSTTLHYYISRFKLFSSGGALKTSCSKIFPKLFALIWYEKSNDIFYESLLHTYSLQLIIMIKIE